MRQNILRMLMVLAVAVRQNLRKRTGGAEAHDQGLKMVQQHSFVLMVILVRIGGALPGCR